MVKGALSQLTDFLLTIFGKADGSQRGNIRHLWGAATGFCFIRRENEKRIWKLS